MQVTLRKPIVVADKKLETIEMDFDALTGGDILRCTHDAQAAKGELVRVVVLDQELHLEIASHLSGIAVADLKRLGGFDYVEVVTAVQGFLTGNS